MAQVIWTTHLRERIKQRGLDPSWVDTAVRYPDEVQQSSTTSSKKHIKTIHGYKIVAAVVRKDGNWIITSAWWDQVYGKNTHQKDNRMFLERWIYAGIVAIEKFFKNKKK